MNSMKLNMKARLAALMTLLAILAVVSGCGGAKPGQPSVIVRDTIVVTETKTLVDTLELYKDTTIIQEKVRVEVRYVDRKVLVRADCLPDTIRITQVKVMYQPEGEKPAKRTKMGFWGFLGYALVIFTLVVAIRKLVDKFFE